MKIMDTQEFTCKCHSGWIMNDDGITASPCECQAIKHNRLMIEKSGLSKSLEKYNFDTYKADKPFQKKILELAKNYVDEGYSDGKWFYIGGQSGAGKTHICTGICKELMEKGIKLKYVTANSALTELKANVLDMEVYYKLLGRLTNPSVLYIDDLFKAKNVSDADVKAVFEIINTRYVNDKVTIVSSEKSIFELEKYDELEAITGRIVEKACKYVVNLNKDTSKNYRKHNFINL